jgi:hypothetical protein
MQSHQNSVTVTLAKFRDGRDNMSPVRGFMAATLGGEPMYMIGERWFNEADTDAICAGKKPYVLDDGTNRFWNGSSWSGDNISTAISTKSNT